MIVPQVTQKCHQFTQENPIKRSAHRSANADFSLHLDTSCCGAAKLYIARDRMLVTINFDTTDSILTRRTNR
jgi:hypothetical protein